MIPCQTECCGHWLGLRFDTWMDVFLAPRNAVLQVCRTYHTDSAFVRSSSSRESYLVCQRHSRKKAATRGLLLWLWRSAPRQEGSRLSFRSHLDESSVCHQRETYVCFGIVNPSVSAFREWRLASVHEHTIKQHWPADYHKSMFAQTICFMLMISPPTVFSSDLCLLTAVLCVSLWRHEAAKNSGSRLYVLLPQHGEIPSNLWSRSGLLSGFVRRPEIVLSRTDAQSISMKGKLQEDKHYSL